MNRTFWVVLCFIITFSVSINDGKKPIGNYEQEWGHVTVRPDVHIFWWLYFTTSNVSKYIERPLILWLQGGPGMPSSGYGNFIEIGPLDLKLQPRNNSWLNNFNLLFVDSPAGTGFSYFSGESKKYAKNTEQIGKDLVSFIQKFLIRFKEFRTVPIYIFGESYGGKMAVEFAYQLQKKIESKYIEANFQGLGLGGAFISPLDYTKHYAPILYNLGMIDSKSLKNLTQVQRKIERSVVKRNYNIAAKLRLQLARDLTEFTNGVDFYNLDKKCNMTSLPNLYLYEDETNTLMNSVIKASLNISENISWNYINKDVYDSLHNDIMRPITNRVEVLLNSSNIRIIVFNGVFDLIVNAAGTADWLENLNWKGKTEWSKATNKPLQVNNINEGYIKRFDNLVYYTVLRAGHSVPVDNIIAMEEILKTEFF